MRKFFLLFSVLFFSTFLVAQEAKQKPTGLEFTTVLGKKLNIRGLKNGLDIKQYKGKIVFLEFWGRECPPCLMSIPHYIDLTKKYKDKIAILAIEVQNTPADILKDFVQKHKINYDIVDYKTGAPLVNYISQRTRWNNSIPYLLIFNEKGEFVTSQVGLIPEEALEGVIKKIHQIDSKSNTKQSSQKSETNTTTKETNQSK